MITIDFLQFEKLIRLILLCFFDGRFHLQKLSLTNVCVIDYLESVYESLFRGEIFDNLLCNCQRSPKF